jgi:hypothetical protein
VVCFCGIILVKEDEQLKNSFSMQASAHCLTCPVFNERKVAVQRLELDQQP